ncbi:MAG: RNA polymerase sigma factor [Pseudomonadota bacterium]
MAIENRDNQESERLVDLFVVETPGLRRYFTHRTGSADEGDDLLQDAWIKLARNVHRALRAPRPYLWRLAVNLANDHQRMARRKPSFEPETSLREVPANTVSPEEQVIALDNLGVLRTALASLPERRRAIFVAAVVDGVGTQDLADKYDISRRMVQIEVRRAFEHCLSELDV